MRVEQKNNTLLEMGLFDDGPFEVGDENRLDPNLVPVPANSYLGECEHHACLFVCVRSLCFNVRAFVTLNFAYVQDSL